MLMLATTEMRPLVTAPGGPRHPDYIEIGHGKEARQSSTFNIGYAQVGNDGNVSPRYFDRWGSFHSL